MLLFLAYLISVHLEISATGAATKNLRRFGQSIKRVVREVKEDSGSMIVLLLVVADRYLIT